VAPAPIVTTHADIFRDLFENRRQCRHCQHALTGLIVLDNKPLTHSSRWGVECAAKTTLSRFFSAAPWFPARGNARRRPSLLQQTQADALRILDDTWGEPVGRLFDSGARPDNHGEAPEPLAPTPVPSHAVSGPVRFPLARRWARRYAARPPWAALVHNPCPAPSLPPTQTDRARLPQAVDPLGLDDAHFPHVPHPLRPTIAVGLERLAAALRHKGPWRVRGVDRGSRADARVSLARDHKKAGGHWRKHTRHLAPTRVVLQEPAGPPLHLEGPPRAVEALVPRIPPTA
jgi:hypothetical protein